MRKIVTGFVLFTIFLGCVPSNTEYKARYWIGPYCAFSKGDEIWLFLEFPYIVQRGGRSYDAPRTIPVGHKQELIVFDEKGIIERREIIGWAGQSGPTFNENISNIFPHREKLVLFSGPSSEKLASLFIWSHDLFVLTSLEESSRFTENELGGVPYISKEKYSSFFEGSSWRFLARGNWFNDESVDWMDMGITFSLNLSENLDFIEIRLCRTEDENEVNLFMIPFNSEVHSISLEEYKNLPGTDYGHFK